MTEPYFALALEWLGQDSDKAMREWQRVERQMGIRDGESPSRRPWVAEIMGFSERYDLDRRWLDGRIDYTYANSIGSRGVYLHYMLDRGRIYEVRSFVSWATEDRYFGIPYRDIMIRISKEEVVQCLTEELLDSYGTPTWVSDRYPASTSSTPLGNG